MRAFAKYIGFVLIILASGYIGKLIVPTFEVFDGSLNRFEVYYLNLTNFLVRGSLAGLLLMAANVLVKVSKYSLCNLLFGLVLAWFILESFRQGSIDMYVVEFQILPFILGAAASMLLFEYVGYLTSHFTRIFYLLRSQNSGE